MTVKIIESGRIEEFDACYAMRLIEQHIAVAAEKPVKKALKKNEVSKDVTEDEDT